MTGMNGRPRADWVIRTATDDDAVRFVTAHEAAWNATLAPIVGRRLGDLASFDDRLARYRAGIAAGVEGAWVGVADRNGGIDGLVVVRRLAAGMGEVRDLYVVPDAWGTGLGARLLTEGIERLRAMGVDRGELWVAEANSRARRFYEREGWSLDGASRSGPLGGRELRYGRSLEPG
jgi:GNAT superfamily N-acetyltransferase